MGGKHGGRIARRALLAALVLGCVVLAPVQLGGSTLFSATVGDSMEPMFHKGDLAILRVSSSYRVGDVVLYQSPVLNRPVLHRILVIQDGKYYFKGDHNTFVDPGYASRADLSGKLWIKVPRAGRVLSWFGKPAHAAFLAGAAAAFLLLGGGAKTARRRRHGRRTHGSRRVVNRPVRSYIHRPRRTVENIVGGAALVLGLVLLVVGFTTPLKRSVHVTGYQQTGAFSYSAEVVHPPASAYPSGFGRTGQPLFLDNFKLIDLGFAYRFKSTLPHEVHGTAALVAVISSDATLRNRYVLQKPKAFSGDSVRVGGRFDLQQLRALITQLSIETGGVSSEYSVELEPVVHVTGVVDGRKIKSTFSPVLPFTATQAVLKLNVAAPATLPGAGYTPPSGASAEETALKPVQPGLVPGFAPNYVSVARYSLASSAVRGFGLALVGLGLILLLSKLFKEKREVWSPEKRIAVQLGCVVIDVAAIGDGPSPDRAPTEVPEFESLATLAKYCERPILRAGSEGSYVYGVEDDTRLYVHRPSAERRPAPAEAVSPAPARNAGEPRPRGRTVARALAALFALAVGATLLPAFTATTTVPLSRAGTSTQARTLAQLAPAACSGIALTNLIVATAATTGGTAGNDLILGRNASGTQTLNGGGGNDCIVGGGASGTTNKFDGGAGAADTNICLGPVGATNTFKNCDVTTN